MAQRAAGAPLGRRHRLPHRTAPTARAGRLGDRAAAGRRRRARARGTPDQLARPSRPARPRGDEAIALVEHLETYATNGLAQLGFAPLDGSVRAIGDRQITCMVTENLPVPARGVSRSEYEPLERQGAALTKLIALLGMGVMSRFPDRQKFMCFDEARLLLDDPAGRRMIDSAQRLGRSKQVVPVIATQYAADVGLERGSVGALFGAVWAFRAVDEADARQQCELLGIDPEPDTLQTQVGLDDGQATVRDHRGQIETIQVTLPASFRRRVETNPLKRAAQRQAVATDAR
ncbi:hypothetical protein GKE82_25720 [Conexibacter sp. W3-3-2]|nr:hypothetical protein [Conexibacter sp. W3-3-2]